MQIKYSQVLCLVLLNILKLPNLTAQEKMSILAKNLFRGNSSNKASVASLTDGEPNHVQFGKNFFILVALEQYFLTGQTSDPTGHINDATGHSSEAYIFNYWVGKMYCNSLGFNEPCDARLCGVPDGASIACLDESGSMPYCKCTYIAKYPQTCGSPKLVLDVENYYRDIPNDLQRTNYVRTINFVTICDVTAVNPMPKPEAPTETIKVPPLSPDLEITMSWSTYVPIPGKSAYYWTMNTVIIKFISQSMALTLNKLGAARLANMLDKEKVREIAKIKGI